MKGIEGGSEGEEWRRGKEGGGPEERVEEGAKEQYIDLPVSLSGL